jgi:hypothetical protein
MQYVCADCAGVLSEGTIACHNVKAKKSPFVKGDLGGFNSVTNLVIASTWAKSPCPTFAKGGRKLSLYFGYSSVVRKRKQGGEQGDRCEVTFAELGFA